MRYIFSGGGTGGHLYPALAIAEVIKEEEPDSEILFVGSKRGIEADVVPKMGYGFKTIPSFGMNEGDSPLQKITLTARFGLSNIAGLTMAARIINSFKPDAVIGTGGYASFSTVMAAQMAKVPTYIHEQNAIPGRANKALAKGAKKLFVGFPAAGDAFGFPEKTVFTGNPVRSDFSSLDQKESRRALSIPEDDFVVFAFGGSLGAMTINKLALGYLEKMAKKQGRTLLWGTGKRFYEDCIEKCNEKNLPVKGVARIEGYIDNMKDYVSSADLLICRAGALSLAELMMAGKPAIIVPIPSSAGNHQYYNAKAVAEGGGAFLVNEEGMDIDDVCEKIEYLAADKNMLLNMGAKCKEMAPRDAARKIYEEIKS